MKTLLVFLIYFIGMIPSYILSMKRFKYVVDRYRGYDRPGFKFDQEVGTAVFTGLSWAGILLLGIFIGVGKLWKGIHKKFNLD